MSATADLARKAGATIGDKASELWWTFLVRGGIALLLPVRWQLNHACHNLTLWVGLPEAEDCPQPSAGVDLRRDGVRAVRWQ